MSPAWTVGVPANHKPIHAEGIALSGNKATKAKRSSSSFSRAILTSWRFAIDAWGVTSSLGVFFSGGLQTARSDEYMQELDAKIDDGDLTTGMFRKGSDVHYFFVIEE